MKSKRIRLMAVLTACAFLFGACSLVTVNEEKDMAQLIAKVGDMEITKGEMQELYEGQLAYYSNFGMNIASTEEEKKALQDDVANYLISQKVVEYQARQQGFDVMSEEILAAINADAQEELDEILEALRELAADDGAEDVDVFIDELFPQYAQYYYGETFSRDQALEKITEMLKAERPAELLMEAMRAQVTITDEEVRAAYDAQLAEDRTRLQEDPGLYKTERQDHEIDVSMEVEGSIPPLYAPEGYRRYRILEIAAQGALGAEYTDMLARMEELTSELGTLTMDPENTDEARADEVRKEYLELTQTSNQMREMFMSDTRVNAQAAYAKLQGGEDFKDILLQYSTDSFAKDIFADSGVLLSSHENDEDPPEQVKTAALALNTPNAYTEVIEVDTACYIVQYLGTEPSGDVDFESVRQAVHDSTLANKQNDEWQLLVEEWMADSTLVTRYEKVIRSVGA